MRSWLPECLWQRADGKTCHGPELELRPVFVSAMRYGTRWLWNLRILGGFAVASSAGFEEGLEQAGAVVGQDACGYG